MFLLCSLKNPLYIYKYILYKYITYEKDARSSPCVVSTEDEVKDNVQRIMNLWN